MGDLHDPADRLPAAGSLQLVPVHGMQVMPFILQTLGSVLSAVNDLTGKAEVLGSFPTIFLCTVKLVLCMQGESVPPA